MVTSALTTDVANGTSIVDVCIYDRAYPTDIYHKLCAHILKEGGYDPFLERGGRRGHAPRKASHAPIAPTAPRNAALGLVVDGTLGPRILDTDAIVDVGVVHDVLKAGASALSALGVGAFGVGSAAATGKSADTAGNALTDAQGRKIIGGEGATKVGESDTHKMFVVSIKKNDPDTPDGEIVEHGYVARPKAVRGDAEVREISYGMKQALLRSGADAWNNRPHPITDGGERFVERSMSVYAPAGWCALTNQTHRFKGGTVELRQAVNTFSVSSIAMYVLSYFTALSGAAITVIAGLLGLVSTLDSFTIGKAELDIAWNTSPQHGLVIAGGWNVTQENNWLYDKSNLSWGHPY